MFSRETQALMEAAVDAVVVIDHRGRLLAVNNAAGRMFDYPIDELLGKTVNELMPEPDASAHDRFLERYLATGRGNIIGVGREVQARRRDGALFPVRLSVGRIAGATPPRFVGLMRDVTLEHQSLAALKLERDRARAFLQLHEAILVELDAEQRVREINAEGARQLGAPAAEIHGRAWQEFFDGPQEREHARLLLAGALASGSAQLREFAALDATGRRRRIFWRCIALRANDGSVASWLCSGTDVTERAQREQDAHLAQERLTRVARLATMGEMASGIAHEINQPLTAITTYARACERYLEMPEPDFRELREAVREIGSEGLRAGEIVQKLRRMVRNDAPAEQQRFAVNALIDELRSLLEADARVHGVELRFTLASGLPAIQVHGVQFQQVILNLARNAFEALLDMPAAARHVGISTALLDDGRIEVRVTDDGPGIAPQIADRLFDPFATTKGSGTGLGLAISRTIVQAHGGTIGVRAADPQGCTFYVQLAVEEECLT